MQSARSRAVRKYEAKIGMVSKTYKVNKEIAERFKEACQSMGISQSKALTDFMREFVEEANAKLETDEK